MDVALNFAINTRTASSVKTSENTLNATYGKSESNHTQSQDLDKINIKHGGLSEDEILEYFIKNDNSEDQKSRINNIRVSLLKAQEDDLSISGKLHVWRDAKRDSEIRQVLRDLEESRDIEKLIFGESGLQNDRSEDAYSNHLRYELNVQLDAQSDRISNIQSKSSSNFIDIRGRSFVPRREADPLVIDLGNDGVNTTGVEKGIQFDLDGDNSKELTSFVKGNDYALALDRNSNGIIDSGNELFGDQNGSSDGIEELMRYDSNSDGFIDSKDKVYEQLRLINSDRPTKKLSQVGIDSIDLRRLPITSFTSSGDRIKDGLKIKMKDGSNRNAYDVYFQFRD